MSTEVNYEEIRNIALTSIKTLLKKRSEELKVAKTEIQRTGCNMKINILKSQLTKLEEAGPADFEYSESTIFLMLPNESYPQNIGLDLKDVKAFGAELVSKLTNAVERDVYSHSFQCKYILLEWVEDDRDSVASFAKSVADAMINLGFRGFSVNTGDRSVSDIPLGGDVLLF